MSSSGSLVNSVVKQRQQTMAVRSLQTNNNNILAQLSRLEHAPGVRRPGCPCCDPDSTSNVIDKLLSQV
jgi:hypothetical protein